MCGQARSQDFAKGGGLFRKLEATVNELDPNFHQSWIRLRRFFCQNQVISKKKKVFTNFGWTPRQKNSTILVQKTASPSQLLLPIPLGELFSFLEQTSALKALKTCYFAYFSVQWGRGGATVPLATLLYVAVLLLRPSTLYYLILEAQFLFSVQSGVYLCRL